MDKDFQTSFIPKKPMIPDRAAAPRPIGFLTIIAIFILVTVIIVSGALYFYGGLVAKNIADMQNQLSIAQNSFEPAKIVQLQVLDKRLSAASEILSKHVAISPIFEALQSLTMKTVRYTKFSYDDQSATKGGTMNVKLSGQADSYRSIALQANLFATNKFFINPAFSNLTLDTNGNVVFDFEFSVDPSFVNYKQMLLTQSQ